MKESSERRRGRANDDDGAEEPWLEESERERVEWMAADAGTMLCYREEKGYPYTPCYNCCCAFPFFCFCFCCCCFCPASPLAAAPAVFTAGS